MHKNCYSPSMVYLFIFLTVYFERAEFLILIKFSLSISGLFFFFYESVLVTYRKNFCVTQAFLLEVLRFLGFTFWSMIISVDSMRCESKILFCFFFIFCI